MSYAFVETTQSLPKPKLLPSMHLWWIESLHFQSRAFVSSTRIHCNSRLESWKWNFLIRAISIPPKRACSQLQKKSTGIISKNLRKTIQEFDYRTFTYIDNKMKLAQTKQCCPAVARDATKLEANVLLARILNDTQCIVPRCATHKVHSTKIISPSICEIQLICSNLNACKNQTSSCNIFLFCGLPQNWTCFLAVHEPEAIPLLSKTHRLPSNRTPANVRPAIAQMRPSPGITGGSASAGAKGDSERRCDVAVFNQQGVAKTAYRSCSSSPVFAWSWLISISCNQIGNHASSHLVHGPTHNHIASSTCRLETPRLRLLFHASLCLLEMIVSVSWLAHLQPCLYESWS